MSSALPASTLVSYRRTRVFAGLSRRVCHAYADAKQDWMAWVDGQMGRKLAGLVRRSPLSLDRFAAHTLISTRLEETAHRVDEIAAVVAKKAHEGSGPVSLEDLDAWRHGLVRADELGEFFYAETAFMAVAHR